MKEVSWKNALRAFFHETSFISDAAAAMLSTVYVTM